MKKKILALLTAAAMIFATGSVLPDLSGEFCSLISASAETVASGTCEDNLTWVLDDSGTLTISGTGEMKNYNPYWFGYSYRIKDIIIEKGVTNIGQHAFRGGKSLTSITIPNSVTEIGDYAFGECTSLTSITIPNSVTEIGEEAFYFCTSLTSITIPDSVTSIGRNVFEDCTSLTSITIPNSVTSIG